VGEFLSELPWRRTAKRSARSAGVELRSLTAMRRRSSHTGTPHERLNVELPTPLLDRVRLRLLDPRTGVAAYGAMRVTVIEALNLWLERQQ
jgi:hypothetical protein